MHEHTIPSRLLFNSPKERAEGELPAAAISCTQSGLFLVILYASVLLPFSILSETNDEGGNLRI